jgi:hypothetical protein
MSRTLAAIAAVGLLVPATSARAQQGPEVARLRALAARAESLAVTARTERERRQRLEDAGRQGRLVMRGGLATVWLRDASPAVINSIVAGADSTLSAYGLIPASFISRLLLVQDGVRFLDSVLTNESVQGREQAGIDWGGQGRDPGARAVAEAVNRRWLGEQHLSWTAWLSAQAALHWRANQAFEYASLRLITTGSSVGISCLTGDVGACRRYLGLDEGDPFQNRYAPADLRSLLRTFRDPRGADVRLCLDGDDAACVAMTRGTMAGQVPEIPAPPQLRDSFLRAVMTSHGVAAVSAALRDTVGAIGARFARATGSSEEALVSAWRLRVLAGGGGERVTAGWRTLLSVLLAIGVMTPLAIGRRQWT